MAKPHHTAKALQESQRPDNNNSTNLLNNKGANTEVAGEQLE